MEDIKHLFLHLQRPLDSLLLKGLTQQLNGKGAHLCQKRRSLTSQSLTIVIQLLGTTLLFCFLTETPFLTGKSCLANAHYSEA